ncbi:hypothetical protein [Streptomyces avicenniae]|uniref:hypothetical protein n=1 Tax=Streptomyces avicenniae TaxID=500153 RepID=UPI00069B329C|nr:hypothetical protein [Streptomyces avicenniae]
MTVPDFVDRRLADVLTCWHMAPGGRPGSVALTGRQFFADGDGVTVLIRVSGDEALASDGGETAVRLADAGIDVYGGTRAAGAWESILKAFDLRELDGRIVGRRPLAQADALAADIASAMLTADGLRWMASSPRDSQLIRQLYDFLDHARLAYTRRPKVTLPRGSVVRPTARVDTPDRSVLVQVAGATEQSIEHALSVVQRVHRARYAFNQRLVLLKGGPEDWTADHLDLLAEHSPVAFSRRMEQVDGFLKRDEALPPPLS